MPPSRRVMDHFGCALRKGSVFQWVRASPGYFSPVRSNRSSHGDGPFRVATRLLQRTNRMSANWKMARITCQPLISTSLRRSGRPLQMHRDLDPTVGR